MREPTPQDSARALTGWAAEQGIDPAELERIQRGLDPDDPVRSRAGHLQSPAILVPGLAASPWHDPDRYPWVDALESRYPRIRDEFEKQYASDGIGRHPEERELAATGGWNAYHFHTMGTPFPEHLAQCPATAEALAAVPGVADAGICYFSVLAPRTRVKPHCGFVNTRIRCHLPLIVPPDCRMRVGTETRAWREGRCSVFDDSFEHEVANDSDRPRAVLLVDTWHPDLTEIERRAMEFVMRMWTSDVD
ncbi:hypothetical protein B4N89_30805 [Embleya scabrispora]|uniref:Aspartyl/asparaginy/proline hydroxylase domain-containing protein n=1 Tax=Embleya scabrispora TaxID=159449 RepID=A0A1T3NP82_9ACTN|nr:aspartyl/asparaginyl beta-hydroxylase domain-containing protein [Embleya scabrispora]OPC78574.1 hypothetical protein B4N89_30805 [Embleya scabrispora]